MSKPEPKELARRVATLVNQIVDGEIRPHLFGLLNKAQEKLTVRITYDDRRTEFVLHPRGEECPWRVANEAVHESWTDPAGAEFAAALRDEFPELFEFTRLVEETREWLKAGVGDVLPTVRPKKE
jgi:hypothetical protein